MQDVDRRNTQRMKKIIAEHGWPIRRTVGSDGTRAAWLLVQHAAQDVAFQRRCLKMMEKHRTDGEVSPGDIAYLTDRVLVNEGKPQLYGTQFHVRDGRRRPRPIREPDNVDKRRKAVGLSTLREYTELMQT